MGIHGFPWSSMPQQQLQFSFHERTRWFQMGLVGSFFVLLVTSIFLIILWASIPMDVGHLSCCHLYLDFFLPVMAGQSMM